MHSKKYEMIYLAIYYYYGMQYKFAPSANELTFLAKCTGYPFTQIISKKNKSEMQDCIRVISKGKSSNRLARQK